MLTTHLPIALHPANRKLKVQLEIVLMYKIVQKHCSDLVVFEAIVKSQK